jgi:hypothetical protein
MLPARRSFDQVPLATFRNGSAVVMVWRPIRSRTVLEQLASRRDLAGGSVCNTVLLAPRTAAAMAPIGGGSLTPAEQREFAKLRRTLPTGPATALRAAE